MLKEIIEVQDWHIKDFPVDLRRKIKAEAALHGESISKYFNRLLRPLLKEVHFPEKNQEI